jgi:ribosomal protein S18 acetylase RimI-like enzyme
MTVRIRDAELADMAALGILQLTCWREAYGQLLSPAFFAGQSGEVRAQRWTQIYAANGADDRLLLAFDDDALVGFAASGVGRGAEIARDTELYALYIRASHYGTGLGSRLLVDAIGDAPAQLWVAEENPRAIAFYRKHGFEFDGTTGVVEFMENLSELRMTR